MTEEPVYTTDVRAALIAEFTAQHTAAVKAEEPMDVAPLVDAHLTSAAYCIAGAICHGGDRNMIVADAAEQLGILVDAFVAINAEERSVQ